MPIAFALIGAEAALLTMTLLETALLDAGVYREGVVIAGLAALFVAPVVGVLQRRPGWRKRAWAVVPIVGAIVGAIIQWRLLDRMPAGRHYVIASGGLDSDNPVAWTLMGALLAVLPAVAAAGLLFVATRVGERSLDARERVLVPLGSVSVVLGAVASYGASSADRPVLLGVVALAAASLVEILVADRARTRWLASAFRGDSEELTVRPLSAEAPADVPLAIGGVRAESLVVSHGPSRYRMAAVESVAVVGSSLAETLAPIIRRRRVIVAVLISAALAAALVLVLHRDEAASAMVVE